MTATRTLPKRSARCRHDHTTSLDVAGMRRELCLICHQMTLTPLEWESEFELAKDVPWIEASES